LVAPFRIAARIEDALGTLFAAMVLDHFLRRPDRPPGVALTAAEARRVRSATEAAIAETGFDVLKTVPLGLFHILKVAFNELVRSDDEGRSPLERFVDAILDGLAEAPNDFVDSLTYHFDEALAREGGTP
jgi:hypothetical protein